MPEEAASRFLQAANDRYKDLEFDDENSIYNDPAPDAWISFLIGGILSIVGCIMWVRRLYALKKVFQKVFNIELRGNILLRAMISAAVDSDDPFYAVVSFAAFSFLFLGGLQLDYVVTVSVMLGTFAIASAGDTIRVLLAFRNATSLADVIVTSDIMKSKMRTVSTVLKPSNVYEDLGRDKTIVIMVFATQVVLISFVVTDIFQSETHTCHDGTKYCPVLGTLGSWGLYVLGIFMACVYLLGPKSSFGQSEQNPAYWLQLLLATKQTGAKCTWNDPVANEIKERILTTNDWRIWARFCMSFLINGVGFHILVHALPLQVAAQSSLMGAVLRALGMMYLVNLDDTNGFTLKLVESNPEPKKEEPLGMDETGGNTQVLAHEEESEEHLPPFEATPRGSGNFDPTALSEESQRIIDEARLKLNALARDGVVAAPAPPATNNHGRSHMAMSLLVFTDGAAGVDGVDEIVFGVSGDACEPGDVGGVEEGGYCGGDGDV